MQLMCGDCLELLNEVPDSSVDMVLADLPYGVTDCKWDKSIPLDELWQQLHRVCKPLAVMAFFGTEPFSTYLRMSNMKEYKYDWIWVKNNRTGFIHAKNMPLKAHEIISVFSGGGIGHKSTMADRRMPYNPQGLDKSERVRKRKHSEKNDTIVGNRPSREKGTYKVEYSNYPRSVLYFDKPISNTYHTNEKPVDLLEYLIRTYTDEGMTMLDPTMGSGSTGVACVNANRDFIGIELDEEYFRVTQERIDRRRYEQDTG